MLCSSLGNPERRPLSPYQLRTLAQRAADMSVPEAARDLEKRDLTTMGYGGEMAQRILSLLSDEALLSAYLRRAQKAGCAPLTRVSPGYPQKLRSCLGSESPGVLWTKGDISALRRPAVALVGSRDILPANADFAREAGKQAAAQGYALVSGNARGADRIAQQACLEAGGWVISVVADALAEHSAGQRVLYVSEDDFDLPFSAQRALSRNRVIHALAEVTFVAQCGLHTGGTWDGTAKNLRFGWSPVCCCDDGSAASRELAQMGAQCVDKTALANIKALIHSNLRLF